MKIEIFHYEQRKKFLIGREIIEDQRPNIGFPADSTDIVPPLENLTEGTIPVFNGTGWDIVPDTFWRPRSREVNYDAGRPASSYKPISLSIYSRHFPHYPSMPMLCNTSLVTKSICQRVRLIHEKFALIIELHNMLLSSALTGPPLDMLDHELLCSFPSLIYKQKLEGESMIYLMRRVLDNLVQLSYLLTNFVDFEETRVIAHNEIGKFANKDIAITNIEKIIIGDGIDFVRDGTNFLPRINDLFNSFKHCLMHDESYNLIGSDFPTLVSYQAKNNDHNNEILYHNYNAYHIMMGFQDTVLRILKNQKIYQLNNSQ